ncbi:MAG: hypothetical protein L3J14_06500 [Flavobacteriaceae bacterium]|nr:hypothetical protein [Flavobacteriaceae bacterium]
MKKTLQILVIGVLLISCKSRKIEGVWMYLNERSLKYGYEWSLNDNGLIFDFDNSKVKVLIKDTILDAHFTFRKKLAIKLLGEREKVNYKIIHNDVIELEFESENDEVSVFKLLDLSYKLNTSKEEIIDFLVNVKLPQIEENGLYDSEGKLLRYLELNFKNDFYKYGKTKSIRTLKSNYFEKSNDDGYWYIGEVNKNFFLFFSVHLVETNVYQIISLNKSRMELKPFYDADKFGITELKVK